MEKCLEQRNLQAEAQIEQIRLDHKWKVIKIAMCMLATGVGLFIIGVAMRSGATSFKLIFGTSIPDTTDLSAFNPSNIGVIGGLVDVTSNVSSTMALWMIPVGLILGTLGLAILIKMLLVELI